ncbi:MAG: hypothetical protein Q8M17_10995 [Actinomycetota bacterium]|nr:hypothetical protein [Actinomycetota bacterium]
MICLTFDTDWMRAEDMEEFLTAYPDLPRSTFFIHEASAGWRPEGHEWGPHPTIDLRKPSGLRAWQDPEAPALGIRSHSCVTSHLLSIEWAGAGFLYQSNETHLFGPGSMPFRTAWGIWELPISYMDNMDMWFGRNWADAPRAPFAEDVIAAALACESVYVFDFHPVHIAFNSSSPEDYVRKRASHAGGASAWTLGAPGGGTRSFFERLLESIRDAGAPTQCASEAVLREQGNGNGLG